MIQLRQTTSTTLAGNLHVQKHETASSPVMTFLCPVLTLPPEITAEIFVHSVEKRHDISRKEEGPLVLAAVCKPWREICFSTCSLWASFLISGECNWDDEDNLRFLERWISRAGSHPLDISIVPYKISRLMTILSPYSSQWRSLYLILNASDPAPIDIVQGRLPSLIKLEIGIFREVPATVTGFCEAPCLREVLLSCLGPQQSIILPWIQLTHLHLLTTSPHKCLSILKEAPNLEALRITALAPHPSEPPLSSPPLPLILAHLHTFSFTVSFPAQGTLLDYLILPAVKALRLNYLPSNDVTRFLELAIRSSWSPRSIRLLGMRQETSHLYLRSLSSLEEVEIYAYPLDSHGLAPLVALLTNDDSFLPNLCKITVHDYPPREISSTGLAEMLASRWRGNRKGVAKLKSFHYDFSPNAVITANALDELKNLVRPLMEEGLEIGERIG